MQALTGSTCEEQRTYAKRPFKGENLQDFERDMHQITFKDKKTKTKERREKSWCHYWSIYTGEIVGVGNN